MKRKKSSQRVPKLGPEEPEAHDEGPRLLPLEGVERRHSFGSSTELSDVALRKPAEAQTRTATKPNRSQGER